MEENIYEPQITENLKNSVEVILKDFEEKYNINVFFACDTGSRALGVAVEKSDFDLNGFFIPDYKEYIRIIRKSDTVISRQGIKFKSLVGDKEEEFEIDIILWDIRDWLKEKIEKNVLGFDFVFESPIIYRNSHPEIIKQMQKFIEPPFYYFWGKFRNNYDLCEKSLKKEGVQHKKLMNTLIYCIQYLHTRIFPTFPYYNIFKEIELIYSNKENLVNVEKKLTEEEFSLLQENIEFIKECYDEKKKGRKSVTQQFPEFVKKFTNLLNNKFNARTRKIEIPNLWDVDIAQNIFDQLLPFFKK